MTRLVLHCLCNTLTWLSVTCVYIRCNFREVLTVNGSRATSADWVTRHLFMGRLQGAG